MITASSADATRFGKVAAAEYHFLEDRFPNLYLVEGSCERCALHRTGHLVINMEIRDI